MKNFPDVVLALTVGELRELPGFRSYSDRVFLEGCVVSEVVFSTPLNVYILHGWKPPSLWERICDANHKTSRREARRVLPVS